MSRDQSFLFLLFECVCEIKGSEGHMTVLHVFDIWQKSFISADVCSLFPDVFRH